MLNLDPDRVTDFLKESAALDVLPRFRALQRHEVMEKKPGDVVTVADIEAEHRLTPQLEGLVPGSLAIGEEAVSRDARILARFDEDAPIWLIDPIDGTHNFTQGDPRFCMMVALVAKNETVWSWIYDPTTERIAIAEKGAGARLNGAVLQAPPPRPANEMVGQVNYGSFEKAHRGEIRSLVTSSFGGEDKLRCAGHDMLGQCLGARDFALYRRLWSWDHAPGVLILRESGGVAERLDGGAYRPRDRVKHLLTARNRETWEQVRDVLMGAGRPLAE